jgi:hypothetical protein
MELLSPRTTLLSQGISDKTTNASLERHNNPETSIISQENASKNYIISGDFKAVKEHTPSFLKKNRAIIDGLKNPFITNQAALFKYRPFGKTENDNTDCKNISIINGCFDKKNCACVNKPIHVNNVNIKGKLDSDENKKKNEKQNLTVNETNLVVKANLISNYAANEIFSNQNQIINNKNTYSNAQTSSNCDNNINIENLNSEFALISKKNENLLSMNTSNNSNTNSNKGASLIGNNIIDSFGAAGKNKNNFFENEDIKKFNSWNNAKNKSKKDINTSAQSKNILVEDLHLEKKMAIFNSTNNSFHSCGNYKFLEPRKSNKNLLHIENNNKTTTFNHNPHIVISEKSYQQFTEGLKIPEKNFFEKDNQKSCSNNSYLYTNNNNLMTIGNNIPNNLISKTVVNDLPNKNIREISSSSNPYDFAFTGEVNKKDLRLKNNEEENSDAESSYLALEAKFVTNNKQIPREERNLLSYNDQNEMQKNPNSLKLLDRSKNIPKDFDCNKDIKFNFAEKEKNINFNFNQQKNSFNLDMSCEIPFNRNNNLANNSNSAYDSIPFGDRKNLINEKINENERNNSNDFLRKFNTSGAAKLPNIFIELNGIKNITTNDSMLIVTAEIDSKKDLFENIYRSYNGSNYKSNRSTSNDSRDNNNNFNYINDANFNLNNFNSRDSVNNNLLNNFNSNNINLKTFNSGNSSNYNSYNILKANSQQQPIKTLEQKDLLNNIMQVNTNFKSNSGGCTNITSKKKQIQKNQIFFPSEINIKNLQTNQK